MEEQLLTIRQAASFLGVSPQTIKNLIKANKLNAREKQSGRELWFSKNELLQYMEDDKKKFSKIRDFLLNNSDQIQKLATRHHKEFLENKKFRSEFIKKYQQNHNKIVKEIAEHFDDDVKKGTVAFKKLGEIIAKDSVKDGLTIEEAVDGIVFLKQALWELLEKNDRLSELTVDEFYRISFAIGTYCDVIASKIAFVYHESYKKKIEKDLLERDEAEKKMRHFTAIVESSSDAIVSKNLDGVITSWNKGAERIFGYKAEEAVGKKITIIIPKELHYEEKIILSKLRNGIPIEHYETTRMRKDGTNFAVSLSISPVKDKNGKVIGASKIARDMTERKKYEEQLRYHVALSQSVRDAVIYTDKDYKITSWNKGAEEIYGWKASEVIGRPGREVLQTEIPNNTQGNKVWQKALATKGYWRGEVIQVRKDGSKIPILASVGVMKDANGQIIGGVGVNRDVTDRTQIEQNLRFLSEASKILSSSLDYNKTLQTVAKTAVPHIGDWCGVDMVNSREELRQVAVAHKDPKKVAWAKEYRKLNPRNMNENVGVPLVIKSGKSVLYPVITDEMLAATAKNEKELELARSLNISSAMIVPIMGKEKAIGAISFVASDTRKRYNKVDLAMAEELASRASLAIENAQLYLQAQKEIEQRKRLERQKNDFIGVASHELKTPVTSIKSFAQVLRLRFKKEGNDKAAELLGKMDAQIDKLTSLIGDLLDVTKIESGRLQFTQEYFAFDDLVIELIEELQRTTEKHSLVIEGVTGKTIFGDRERIGQVITNLVSNAIKYSPYADKIFIKTSVDDKYIKLCVQDFGIGIPEDKQDKVFERFFRASGPGQETFPGLGLGLYVSSEIIKRLKGKIWVESLEGKGSTFCFILPIGSKPKRNTERS